MVFTVYFSSITFPFLHVICSVIIQHSLRYNTVDIAYELSALFCLNTIFPIFLSLWKSPFIRPMSFWMSVSYIQSSVKTIPRYLNCRTCLVLAFKNCKLLVGHFHLLITILSSFNRCFVFSSRFLSLYSGGVLPVFFLGLFQRCV